MIERRRMPMPHAPSMWKPSSSGPRWTLTRAIACSVARSAGLPSRLRMPKTPHMVGTSARPRHLHGALWGFRGKDLPEKLQLPLRGGFPAELLGKAARRGALARPDRQLADRARQRGGAALLDHD